MKIVLASASPRRKELLERLGIRDMEILPARGEEKIQEGLPPEKIVEALSLAKASEVAARCGDGDVIIAADTIVWQNDRIFGKPKDEKEAEEMLLALSGKEHSVFTGVTVIASGKILTKSEETKVHFRELSGGEIRRYIDSGEPMDKAGAYGIQGRASVFVRGIEGDFFNVVGLPLCLLYEMLMEQGVELL